MLTVVNNVLELASLEAGRITIDNAPFRPAEVLAKSLRLWSALGAEKGLQLTPDVTPDLQDWALGDATRLWQVCGNLLGNAVKFTECGVVTLRGRIVRPADSNGLLFRVEVDDTGIGIREAVLPRLFTMFEQAERGKDRRFGGTGLGLAICRRLSEATGGQIGAESDYGRGSRFWFEVPL